MTVMVCTIWQNETASDTVQSWKKKKLQCSQGKCFATQQFYDRKCCLIFLNIKHFFSFFKHGQREKHQCEVPSHGTKAGVTNKKIFIIHHEVGRMNDEHNISICITRTTHCSFMPCINYWAPVMSASVPFKSLQPQRSTSTYLCNRKGFMCMCAAMLA